MNIAHLLPYTARFPLQKHNGRYEWVLRLALEQVINGHTVSLYAAPGSGKGLSQIIWKTSPSDLGDKRLNNTALLKTAFQSGDHDIYHSHFDYLHYQLADLTSKPVVFTQHWFPDAEVVRAVPANRTHNVVAVPPTHYMHEENKRLGIPTVDTIHHGVDLSLFHPQSETVTDRLIFVGRISPRKGVLEAVQLALDTHQPLDIVGKLNESDRAYWNRIAPLVDGQQIRYLGPKSQTEVAMLLAQAKAFLFPSKSKEAFGQVTIEAQACGTPVIISDIGPSRELVDDGKTGFIATTENDYTQALQKLDSIDRAYCRKFAEKFDIKRMVTLYDDLYTSLLS